jgi:flagellar hook-basal body complex protein FliE
MDKFLMIILMNRGYWDMPPQMHKTTVEVDLNQLRKAQQNLGTHGFKETINRALEDVNQRAALARAAQYIAEGRMSVPTLEELWEMREPRT